MYGMISTFISSCGHHCNALLNCSTCKPHNLSASFKTYLEITLEVSCIFLVTKLEIRIGPVLLISE